MKTLKQFFEVYRPKAPDEQKFVDKHVTIKHKDRNGNGDDVFKATNIKTIERKSERHGYDVGEDEKVYEEVEDLDEGYTIRSSGHQKVHVVKNGKIVKTFKDPRDAQMHIAKLNREMKEEVEELDELSNKTLKSYIKKASNQAFSKGFSGGAMLARDKEDEPDGHKNVRSALKRVSGVRRAVDKLTNEEVELDESLESMSDARVKYHATKNFPHGRYSDKEIKAEHNRRSKSVPNYHAVKPSLNEEGEVLHTSAEDRVLRSLVAYYEELGEEVLLDDIVEIAEEMIAELSKKTLGSYVKKASHDVATRASATARYAEKEDQAKKSGDYDTARKNSKIADKAFNKGWDRRKHIAKAVDRLTKEDVINRTIAKYVPEDVELPSMEERLVAKLQDQISEGHILTLLDLFSDLSEQNQMAMLDTIETQEGINSLIDFALDNRGE